MIYVKCSICGDKEYYQTRQQLFNDLRMVKTSKKKIICNSCLNERMCK